MKNGIIVLIIFLMSCFLSIALVAFKPSINVGKKRPIQIPTYFFGVLLGAVIILLSGLLPWHTAILSIEGSHGLSPLGTLVLFLSMVFISIFLDQTGFFEYCAKLSLKYSKGSPKKMFFATFITVFILTIFTSNDDDIIIFTPFIYYMAKNAKINPIPYLFAEFFAANTSSIMLYTGNPTNIIIAGALGLDFAKYTYYMFLPTIAAGAVILFGLYFVFRKQISKGKKFSRHVNMSNIIRDKTGAAIGLSLLLGCIATLSLSSALRLDMWKVSLLFAMLTALAIISRRLYFRSKNISPENASLSFQRIFERMPWSIVPFILSLFVIVEALNLYMITANAGLFLSNAAHSSPILASLLYGFAAALSSNLINNIPMTIAFVPTIAQAGTNSYAAALSTTIGSNLGANLTPFGALAGIMWLAITKTKGVKIKIAEFIKLGFPITMIALFASLSILGLEFFIFS